MFTPAKPLRIDANQQNRLTALVRSGKTPQKVALRARIVLLTGEGIPNHAIAARLGTSRPTVLLWRSRFQDCGVPGLLKDAPRSGRKKAIWGDVGSKAHSANSLPRGVSPKRPTD